MRLTLLVTLALSLGLYANSQAAVVNGSFESNTFDWQWPGAGNWKQNNPLVGWTVTVGSQGNGGLKVVNSAVPGKDGNNVLEILAAVVRTNATDRIAVSPGDTVKVDLLFRHLGTSTDTRVYLDFFTTNQTSIYENDSSGKFISSTMAKNLPNKSWPNLASMSSLLPYTGDTTAPAGAAYVGVRIVTPPENWEKAVQVDNVRITVTPIPEPASAGLIGLVSLLLLRRP